MVILVHFRPFKCASGYFCWSNKRVLLVPLYTTGISSAFPGWLVGKALTVAISRTLPLQAQAGQWKKGTTERTELRDLHRPQEVSLRQAAATSTVSPHSARLCPQTARGRRRAWLRPLLPHNAAGGRNNRTYRVGPKKKWWPPGLLEVEAQRSAAPPTLEFQLQTRH